LPLPVVVIQSATQSISPLNNWHERQAYLLTPCSFKPTHFFPSIPTLF